MGKHISRFSRCSVDGSQLLQNASSATASGGDSVESDGNIQALDDKISTDESTYYIGGGRSQRRTMCGLVYYSRRSTGASRQNIYEGLGGVETTLSLVLSLIENLYAKASPRLVARCHVAYRPSGTGIN